jgi:hypothetical protein
MRDRTIFFSAFTLRDFLAVDYYVARRLYADANLCAVDGHYSDFDIVTNS